jgi:hypothetical protein
MGELKLLFHNMKPDVICITEVSPKRNMVIQDSEIQIPYYEAAASKLQECDRGCIIYVKTGCEYQQISTGADSAKIGLETLFIKVSDLVFGCVYRSPSQTVEEKTESLHLLNTAFSKLIDMKHPMYILGNFNFSEIKWDENQAPNHPFVSMLKDHRLTQLVNGSTRFRENTNENTLGLVLTCSPETVYQLSSLPPLRKSDHMALLVQMNLNQTKPQYHNRKEFRNLNKSKLKETVSQVDWIYLQTGETCDQKFELFQDIMISRAENSTKTKKSCQPRTLPHIKSQLKRLMNIESKNLRKSENWNL